MEKLRCMICGVEINEKNYNFNNKAFNSKNTDENIIYCPFCGAGKEYLSSNDEKYDLDNIKLSEKEIIILDHAAKLEVFNGDFYKKAVNLSKSDEIKKIFEALSKIEYMHAKIHSKLAGLNGLPLLAKIDYSKYNEDDILLLEAKKREVHAVSYYSKYYNEIDNEIIKKIFIALSSVEKEHIQLIEKN
ncbi:MAG: metal-iron-binding protein [Bacillota bacterium]|nr:metal-iron-binding protein [Bacillota bacterium]